MKISIGSHTPYEDVVVDTGAHNVNITDAFVGASFVTEDGEILGVCMRDSGFELTYIDSQNAATFVKLNAGTITVGETT